MMSAHQEWSRWSTTMRLVTPQAADLSAAREIVDAVLDDVELAASRFRPDGEILQISTGAPVRVSQTLTELLAAALDAARVTGGAVDPTVGSMLVDLGYDRDIDAVRQGQARVEIAMTRRATWRDIRLDEANRTVTLPRGVVLDLGATAKAWAADRCAQAVAMELGIAVLVSLGGDIATVGPTPGPLAGPTAAPLGWDVLVRDRDEDPAAMVHLPDGLAVATSSTQQRTWRGSGMQLHHIIDPSTGMPAQRYWRSVTVVAQDCVTANIWSTAALVRGGDAVRVLRELGLPARLVTMAGQVRLLGGWPAAAELGGAA
ncbi:MAG TPA: FAD:protein FMN transferase [Dermatophilaceae bacterium]|jgi:thiamine biosynthesis lipoprotein|nr:FAD:protein FMN transferase [Dermatophilaceae bacterium]